MLLESWKNPGLSGLPTNRGFRNHSGRVLESAGYPGLGLGPTTANNGLEGPLPLRLSVHEEVGAGKTPPE